jgi:hypothetical protein
MLTTTVCAALSAAGLAVAFMTAYRRRFAAATRIAALSLVPVGLAMAGLIGLGGKIVKAVGTWAADLVLDPTVWSGFAVLAVAFVLYVVGRLAGGKRAGRKERRAAARAEEPRTTPGKAAGPAIGAGAASSPAPGSESASTAKGGKPASGGGDEDFSDIEAILKKHGI